MSQEPRGGLVLRTLALGGTAAISLFAGGVGLVNVMVMMVVERGREIGIHRATGAGGTIGVIIGIIIGALAAAVFRTPVIFSLLAIAAAVLCAVLGGLAFGFPTAWRDARFKRAAAPVMKSAGQHR